MAIKLPKYVSLRRAAYHYQRQIPSKLSHLTSHKFFTAPLRLKEGASELKLFQAADQANRDFELFCKTLSNSDPSAFEDTEIDKLATKLLAQRGFSGGDFARVKTDESITRREEQLGYQLQAYPEDYAAHVVPEIDDFSEKAHTGEALTVKEKVIERAYKALIRPRTKSNSQTLAGIWSEYLQSKGKDSQNTEVKKATRRWERFLAFVGDGYLVEDSKVALLDGLDEYVLQRRADAVTEATIHRELADVVACINHGAEKRRLTWKLSRPKQRHHDPALRTVLTLDEQTRLVKYCLNPDEKHGPYAAIVLLGLLGGVIPTEVSRISAKNIHLNGKHPYVAFLNKGKTEHRRRVVPIVLGVDICRLWLDSSIKWANDTSPSNVGACIGNFIKKQTGNDSLSIYSLRHTFKMNATQAEVPVMAMNAIAGWTGGYSGSREMLAYGSAALEGTEQLSYLYKASVQVQGRLLAALKKSDQNT